MSRLAALLALVVLAGACTDDKDAGPPTTRDTPSTSVVDYTGVDLPGVGGETTTTIQETGTARLVGTVTGPTGPVGGATVSIDRLVSGQEIHHDVVAAADGRWELRDVPGGRYRVRAFLAPTYAQTTPEVLFLPDGDEHAFDLVLEDQRDVVVRADVAPDQPLLDGDVNLVVLVVQRTVAADGIVRSTPMSGTFVELLGLGRWQLREDTTSTTFDDGSSSSAGLVLSDGGRGTFELTCVRAGAPGLSLRVPVTVTADPAPPASGSTTTSTEPAATSEDVTLEVPECVDPSAPTTTTSTPSTTP